MDFFEIGILESMKAFFIFLFTLLGFHFSFAQNTKQDTTICTCHSSLSLTYPDGSDSLLQGEVIIEYDIDSTCISSNPVVIKSLGPAYDKEALKFIDKLIIENNKCIRNCPRKSACKKGKEQQKIEFKGDDE